MKSSKTLTERGRASPANALRRKRSADPLERYWGLETKAARKWPMRREETNLQYNFLELLEPQSSKLVEAVYILRLEECRDRPLRPGETNKFNVWFDESLLVERHRTPMLAACRKLIAMGLSGKAQFIYGNGTRGMTTWDIAQGAGLTVAETSGAPRFTKYIPFEKGIVTRDVIGDMEAGAAGEIR